MANYPQELAQNAVCQSHTGHMTGLWFLPTRLLRLNTNDDDGWLSGQLVVMSQPPTRKQKHQCRIDTVSSLDDGHIVVRNM